MKNNPLPYCIFAALCFGCWPILGRFAGLGSGWLSLLVATGTAILASVSLLANHPGAPSVRSVIIGLTAGAINGIGMLAYAKVIGWQGEDVSKVLPIAMILTPLFAMAGALIFLGEPVTGKKLIGAGLACVGVYLLS